MRAIIIIIFAILCAGTRAQTFTPVKHGPVITFSDDGIHVSHTKIRRATFQFLDGHERDYLFHNDDRKQRVKQKQILKRIMESEYFWLFTEIDKSPRFYRYDINN